MKLIVSLYSLRWREILLFVATLFILYACRDKENYAQEKDSIKKQKEIHQSILTLDTHIDIEVSFFTPEKNEIGYQKLASLQALRAGMLDAAFFTCYVLQGPLSQEGYENATNTVLEKIKTIHRVAETEIPEEVEIAYHPEDVFRIHKKGKIVATIGIENGYALGTKVENVKKFYELGVRYITLSHVGHNQICDSNLDPHQPQPLHNGLSSFGESVVKEMNRLGMIIDVSHIGKKSVLDVLRLSQAPIIASHSCLRRFSGQERMWDDEQLLALKKNRGVFNVVGLKIANKPEPEEKIKEIESLRKELGFPSEYWPFFLAFQNAPQQRQKAYNLRLEEIEKRYPSANIQDFVDQIEYIINLIGIDHVGISSDFYDETWSLNGWRDASETLNITLELLKRGYKKEEIGKIWSGNLLRVWREVERVGKNLSKIRKTEAHN